MSWLDHVATIVTNEGAVARAVVIGASGSTPRETGAAMLIWASGSEGSIGGGALEHAVIARAHRMIAEPAGDKGTWRREVLSYPLGPTLGQCCGGHVKVLVEVFGPAEVAVMVEAGRLSGVTLVRRPLESGRAPAFDAGLSVARVSRDSRGVEWLAEPLAPPLTPVYLYGAGHVGRALVRVLDGLPFAVRWIDVAPDRFPDAMPANVARVVAEDPVTIAGAAPADAAHLVMTYSHALDLEICDAVLRIRSFRSLGLIGSATKRARFENRLRRRGVEAATLRRLVCPIGLPGIRGKAPAVIAVAVAAELLLQVGADAPAADVMPKETLPA